MHGDIRIAGRPGKEALERNGVQHGRICLAERGRIFALAGFGFPHLGLVSPSLKLLPGMERRCYQWPGGISDYPPLSSTFETFALTLRWDDSFVTGLLRERLNLSITCLTPGPRGDLWDLLLSHCPIFSLVKQHLFNDIVLRKGPADMPYVNSYKFFLCNTLEFHLERLETTFSFVSPLLTPFWSVCARK